MIALCFIFILVQVSMGFLGEKDEVLILPGLRIQPSFKHYSGYLNGSDTRKLHYWFVESQKDAAKDPLVLWMNGGPGCSSLDGLISEHGPFRANEGGYLTYNPFSWNKVANIIYLESPACVGFSYSTNGDCNATDDTTSQINFMALLEFLGKFPQYQNHDFYITGESYGGYYVPSLAEMIVLVNQTPYIRFKGIAVGNGLSSRSINDNGNLHFSYNHGLISDSLWREIIAICCHNVDPLHCNISGNMDHKCQEKVSMATDLFSKINPYNIYASCAPPDSDEDLLWSRLGVSSNYDRSRILMGWLDKSDPRIVKLRTLKLLNSRMKVGKLSVPCTSDRVASNYLNNPLVRLALHIPPSVQNWSMCSDIVYLNFKTIYSDMNRQYNNLFKLKDFKIWIYNGDVDMMCSYLSDEWYFERFNQTIIRHRMPWMYKDINNVLQVGGYEKIWDKFSLITVIGAGHMVPTDKPAAAYHMFESFITGKDL